MGAVAVGAALHPLMQLARRRSWVAFVDTSPEKFAASLLGCQPPCRPNALHLQCNVMYEFKRIHSSQIFVFAGCQYDTR